MASRWWIPTSALLLAACSSTPLPQWTPPATRAPASTAAPTAPSAPSQPTGSTALEPLPYSAAIAALFPDPAQRYQTPALSAPLRGFTTNAELQQLLQRLSSTSRTDGARLALVQAGQAQSGQPLHAVIATRASSTTPVALDGTQRPTLMLVAGQDGLAPASTEAVIALLQELAPEGLLSSLLDRVNLVIVPRANPDGFERKTSYTLNGTDLRQDHLRLHTPEARVLAKLMRDYRPVALVDTSEFAAMGPTLQRFSAVRAHDAGLMPATGPNTHEFILKASREWLHQPIDQALRQSQLRVDWAAEPTGSDAASGFATGTQAPTALRNAAALKHITTLEVRGRGSDLGRTHLQRRIHTLVQAMNAAIQSAADRGSDWRKVQAFAQRETAANSCRHHAMTVLSAPRQGQRTLALVDVTSAQIVEKPVAWTSSIDATAERVRAQPCGYWLSAQASTAVERLTMQGVTVQKVAEAAQAQADTYASAGTPGQVQAAQLQRTTLDVPAGSYYVSLNQPLAHLATAALEPDTPYSYYQQGVLRNLSEVARITASPNVVFEDE